MNFTEKQCFQLIFCPVSVRRERMVLRKDLSEAVRDFEKVGKYFRKKQENLPLALLAGVRSEVCWGTPCGASIK